MTTIKLPPLPEPYAFLHGRVKLYTQDDLHTHAAAVSATKDERIKVLEDALRDVYRLIGQGGGAYDISQRTTPVIRTALGDKP